MYTLYFSYLSKVLHYSPISSSFYLFVLTMFDKKYALITTYMKEEESRQSRTLHNEWKLSEVNARNTLLISHNHLIPTCHLSKIPYHILKMMMLYNDWTSYGKPQDYSIKPLKPSLYFMQAYNQIQHSTFCPHSLSVCFVWISEQTAIISLHSINWLVFYNRDGVSLLRCWTLSFKCYSC